MRLCLAFLIGLLLSSPSYAVDPHEGKIVKSGFIFSAEQSKRIIEHDEDSLMLPPRGWMPSENDVSAIYDKLAPYLKSYINESTPQVAEDDFRERTNTYRKFAPQQTADKEAEYWIQHIKKGVPSLIDNFASFKMQYLGYLYGKERWVYVHGACASDWKESQDWKYEFVSPKDNECLFTIKYNVTKSYFKELMVWRN